MEKIYGVGDKFEAMTLPNQDGVPVDLSSFVGKNAVILVMYPGDDTPGCTAQLCALRDQWADVKKAGAVVFGVNHADAKKHKKFADKYEFPFDLLVDEGRGLITKFGALKKFFRVMITSRTVVIVDKAGVIRFIKKGMPDVKELLAEIQSYE